MLSPALCGRIPYSCRAASSGWRSLAAAPAERGGTGTSNTANTTPTTTVQPKEATELDKLMRTQMNTPSKLIYLVFHAEAIPTSRRSPTRPCT